MKPSSTGSDPCRGNAQEALAAERPSPLRSVLADAPEVVPVRTAGEEDAGEEPDEQVMLLREIRDALATRD